MRSSVPAPMSPLRPRLLDDAWMGQPLQRLWRVLRWTPLVALAIVGALHGLRHAVRAGRLRSRMGLPPRPAPPALQRAAAAGD